eukprot:TRINITY_DN31293_c0_g1_i1.p1 TRINITY_DN31293_c0_g1~~TRINITY_DN31293_c0_g1_i1.p1  ORF type:complete len:133 (-),score=16.14 TRINITY_DN31293_c0_g1_i1:164-562(-)
MSAQAQLGWLSSLEKRPTWWPKMPYEGPLFTMMLDAAPDVAPLEAVMDKLRQGRSFEGVVTLCQTHATAARVVDTCNALFDTPTVRLDAFYGRPYYRVAQKTQWGWSKAFHFHILIDSIYAWMFERRSDPAA